MKYTICTLLFAFAALLLSSCGENTPPQPQPQPQANLRPNFFTQMARARTEYSPNLPNQNPTPSSVPGSGNNPVPPTPAKPVPGAMQIPDDARWTLSCATFAGPDRFARTQQWMNYMKTNTPLKSWYVVHEAQASTLFYGFYSAVERKDPDPMLARAAVIAQADREKIARWTDSSGQQPFARCTFQEIVPPDPIAPTEWNLLNTPPRAVWSLQVAAFKDNVKRKEAAVLAVKELRDKGIEAYFYHGSTISSVLVGAWPEEAIKKQEADGSTARDVLTQSHSVLVSADPLPSRYANAREIRDKDGNRVDVLTQRVDIADPTMIAAKKEFPDHFVNYNVIERNAKAADGSIKKVRNPSFLVKIPRAERSLLNDTRFTDPRTNPNTTPRRDPSPSGGTGLPAIR